MKYVLPVLVFVLGYSCKTVAQRLTVMSYNIHHGADKNEVDQLEQMATFIKSSGAELVGLQEVDSVCTRSGNVDQMKKLARLTGMHYAFARHFAYQGGAYGMGILSKFPIRGVEVKRMTLLKSKNPSTAMIVATIAVKRKRHIKFAAAHFALDDSSRWVQARQVVEFLKEQRLPVIFTGDLNATPDSKEIQYLHRFFTSADSKGTFTFPAPQAVKQIDYILVSKPHLREVEKHAVPINDFSDHLPVQASLIINTHYE
ncbi:endonuclease/exonuclease/phosphatase family protein [Niabella insulamsoli]|uniref:endonuclease/exonuclease/phosphatase family protein n=1 Tax=Niabella insulamsoli TaxID=3144874 RepID=UPI0031FD3F95